MTIPMHFDFPLLALSKNEQDLEQTISYYINGTFLHI